MAQNERRREITSSTCSKRSTQVIFRLKAYIDERQDSTLVEVILTVELTRYLRHCENSGIRIKNKKPTRRETNLRPIAKRHK